MVWLYGRSAILHPYHLIVVASLLSLLAAAALALFLGFQQLAHGPNRGPVAGWVLVALAPLVFWGFIGAYGARQWRKNNVPHNLMMQLSVSAGSALMRLESSFEYPHRLETDHMVMLYDALEDPHSDGEAMDRHMGEMVETLGTAPGAKVIWVRGRLPVLDLGELSVHEIALGSAESPKDWKTDGQLDRHELAHAVLDAVSAADADPPSFLHEGWAEAKGASNARSWPPGRCAAHRGAGGRDRVARRAQALPPARRPRQHSRRRVRRIPDPRARRRQVPPPLQREQRGPLQAHVPRDLRRRVRRHGNRVLERRQRSRAAECGRSAQSGGGGASALSARMSSTGASPSSRLAERPVSSDNRADCG